MLTPHYGELTINYFELDITKLSKFATDASIIEQALQGKEEKDLFGVAYQGNRETEILVFQAWVKVARKVQKILSFPHS